MKFIGAHVDTTPDLSYAPLYAAELGARAFALNLVDPSKWRSPELTDEIAGRFRTNCATLGFKPFQILPHAGFVINLCSPDSKKLNLSRLAMVDEMNRARKLGLTMLNFHPGAHLKQMSEDDALTLVSESLNRILDKTEGVTAVIENTAGQGSNVGYSFGQLGAIIDRVEDKTRVGVCIDTAHAFAAGYNLSVPAGYDAAWEDFDRTVGFSYLRGVHLNDSQRAFSSRIDRHASIGKGEIGMDFFARLMNDKRFNNIPMILETPDPSLWKAEIAGLYAMAEEQSMNQQ